MKVCYSKKYYKYKGFFEQGLLQGKGTEETKEFDYVGDFKNEQKEGEGKIVYKILNDVYEGSFRNNSINGVGFYIWANKDTFKGEFLNGKMHGKGLYKWVDGGEYEGSYINNIKEGFGKFKWTNGKIFEGQFKSGNPHGQGNLTIHGETVAVEFDNGKLVKNKKNKMKKAESKGILNNNNHV